MGISIRVFNHICCFLHKAHYRRGEALSALGRADEAALAHAEAFRLSDGHDELIRTALINKCTQLEGPINEIFAKEYAHLQLASPEADGCALLNTIAKCFQLAKKAELARHFYQISAKMSFANISKTKFGQKQLKQMDANDDNWAEALHALEHKLEIAELMGDEAAQMATHGQMSKILANKLFRFDLAICHCVEQLRLADNLSVSSTNSLRLELANLHLKMRSPEQAKGVFKQILEEQPSDPGALLGLGQAFYLTNELQSALTIFNRVEKMASPPPVGEGGNIFWQNAILGKCHCHLFRGDTEKTIETAGNMLKNATSHYCCKFYLPMALSLMKCGKLPEAMRWAKRMLTAQINGNSGGNMIEALYTVMVLYEKMGQWENAEKVGEQLLNQLENCPWQTNPFGPSPEEILSQVSQIQRQLTHHHEQIGRIMELRLKLMPKFSDEWAKIAMEMAKMNFEWERWDTNCVDLVQNLSQWTEQRFGPMKMELNPDPTRVRWEVGLLTVRAELAWKTTMANELGKMGHKNSEDETDDSHPFTLLETALMLAQEAALTDAEADICLLLGEWHLAKGGDEEAAVYLRQVIALERQNVPANQRRLLRTYSALIKVLCTQCQWEDAFSAARRKLGIQKFMRMPLVDRLRTQLVMGQILLETAKSSKRSDGHQSSSGESNFGTLPEVEINGSCHEETFCSAWPEGPITAMQIFQRIRRRAKCLNAIEESQLAEECLEQCRKLPKTKKVFHMNPSSDIGSEFPQCFSPKLSGASKTPNQRKDFDTYCCIRDENCSTESNPSGAAQVIGIDFDDD